MQQTSWNTDKSWHLCLDLIHQASSSWCLFHMYLPDTTNDRFWADPASLLYVVFVAKLQIPSSA